MNLGQIVGTVVATQKDPGIQNVKLRLLQPLNENLEKAGGIIVAADPLGCNQLDVVMWVSSREASLALDEKFAPVDAAVVGLVDMLGSKRVDHDSV